MKSGICTGNFDIGTVFEQVYNQLSFFGVDFSHAIQMFFELSGFQKFCKNFLDDNGDRAYKTVE